MEKPFSIMEKPFINYQCAPNSASVNTSTLTGIADPNIS